ncbi:MAG: hypothetical protein ABII18_06485, partial [bacterium]
TAKERQKKYRYMTNEIIKDDHRTHKCPYRKKDNRLMCFIGNPLWVKERYEKLIDVTQEKRREWLKQYSREMGYG